MSVIRVVHNKENPYVMLNKKALWDETLSLKAVGLWARCMSRPDNWRFNIPELEKNTSEGKRAIYAAMNELIEAGYVIRYQTTNSEEKNRFGTVEYVIFEFALSKEERANYLEELKKSLPRCGFAYTQNAPLLINDKKKKTYRKESIKPSDPKPIPIPDVPKKPVKKVDQGSIPLSRDNKEKKEGFAVYCESKGVVFSDRDLSLWVKNYDFEYLHKTFQALLEEIRLCELKPKKPKIKNPITWMQKALTQKFIELNQMAKENKELAQKLKSQGWKNLKITTRYAVDETTGKDYQYSNLNFKSMIMNDFEGMQ